MGAIERPRRTQAGRDIDGNEMQFKSYSYNNIDAVENVIHYVTRSRKSEKRAADLLAYGAVGAAYYLTPDDMICQFLYIQNIYRIDQRGGRRIYHEVFNLLDSEVTDARLGVPELWSIGMECCQVYYNMGFQAVFAVHWEPGKRYHIHFVVNSISFATGYKWHSGLYDIKQREEIFNRVLLKYRMQASKVIVPICYQETWMPHGCLQAI